jgi:pimeloyl-ACP methyl ester carboxylesterase
MPTLDRDGGGVHYETRGPEDAPAVAFVGGAGQGAWLWGWQAPAVVGPGRAVVVELGGAGRSRARPDAPSVADLVGDLTAALEAADAARPHLVCAGLGAVVAVEYAREREVRSLVVLGGTVDGDRYDPPPTPAVDGADGATVEAYLATVCSPAFRERQPEAVEGVADWIRGEDAPPAVRRRVERALCAGTDRLYEVTAPALVVHGEADRVVPVAAGRALAGRLPRGECRTFEGAGHLVGVERSRPVNDRLVGFLAETGLAVE